MGVASPECYEVFLKIISYNDVRFSFLPLKKLIISAYAVQHLSCLEVQIALGIDRDARASSVQDIPLHLLRLFLTVEKGFSTEKVEKEFDDVRQKILEKRIIFLEPKRTKGLIELRATDVWDSINYAKLTQEEYVDLMRRFAETTWDAWFEYHDFVRNIYKTHR